MTRISIRKFFRWSFLRWLLLLPTLWVSFYLTLLILEFYTYFSQSIYFDFLDRTHRHATRLADSFFILGVGGGLVLVVIGIFVCGVLAIINLHVRKKIKTFIKSIIFASVLCSLVGFLGILVETVHDRKLPLLKAAWKVDHVPIGVGGIDQHNIHEMAFADPDHLIINTGGQLISFATETGQILATNTMIGGPFEHVFASPSGKVILSTGDQLKMFSAKLAPLGSSLLVPDGGIEGISPSGARLAWQHYTSTAPKTTFIDTETLKPAETFADCNVRAMTDHSIAESVDLMKEGGIPAINVCDPGTASHILYRDRDGNYSQFVYLNNELMLMIGRKFLLLDPSGKTISSDDWPNQHVDFAGGSRDGSRFAIAIERWGWGDPAESNKVTLIIYNTASFRPIAEIPSAWVCAFSPDGKAIAASSGTSTSYYRLP